MLTMIGVIATFEREIMPERLGKTEGGLSGKEADERESET
ncbi:hypothetical protein [Aeromonas dhakensis]|nr:hypothetical protein [Aeromonas dhakensis]